MFPASTCSWRNSALALAPGRRGRTPMRRAGSSHGPVRTSGRSSQATAQLVERDVRVLASAAGPEPNQTWLAISPCPFYPQGGGQCGDRGVLELADGTKVAVLDTTRPYPEGIALLVDKELCAGLAPGSQVSLAQVDRAARLSACAHHTATHMVHAALRAVLGEQVMQAGSQVTPERLRFDFSHGESLTADQIRRVEDMVNQLALANVPVTSCEKTIDDARASNALMLFGEKYGEVVRVVSVEGTDDLGLELRRSVELCGGTHVASTSQVFPFKLVSEGSVAAGTRRVEAVAGNAAKDWFESRVAALGQVGTIARVVEDSPDAVVAGVLRLKDREAAAKLQIRSLHAELAASASTDPVAAGGGVCVHLVPDLTPGDAKASSKATRDFAERAAEDRPAELHIVVCGGKKVVAVSRCPDWHAGRALRAGFSRLGGKGGGGDKFAQGQFDDGCCPVEAHDILAAFLTDKS